MTCPSLEELAAYSQESLPAGQAQRIHAHVTTCAVCQQELIALARTDALLASIPAQAVPDDLWQGVAARIQARPQPVVRLWWGRALAGVGVAASLALGVLLMRAQQQPTLSTAPVMMSSYVADHQFLSAQDPLTDRASLGVVLASQQGEPE